jgi:hypothetical protein
MEVKKERHGVFATVGIATCAVCPRDCSMYMSSLALIVGCFDGFSKDNHSQTIYQMRPATPGTTKHNRVGISLLQTIVELCRISGSHSGDYEDI